MRYSDSGGLSEQGNLLVWGIDELVAVMKTRLKRIQYRPGLLDAFLAHTGLDLEPVGASCPVTTNDLV